MTIVPSFADVCIIGGGIAGASAAYEIAAFASVILLERERHCGLHATGRSAASFSETYGNDTIRRLALASRGFLNDPPAGFCDFPLLKPRGTVTIARADQTGLLDEALERALALVPSVARLAPAEALARVPILRPEAVAAAMIEPHAMEIDVDGLHRGFLRGAVRRGARIVVGAGVTAIARSSGGWRVATSGGEFEAAIVVDAAGAWADEIAELAGLRPFGLVPKRRTACLVPAPAGLDVAAWPLVDDIGESFYFKPDAGQIFVSPADATPSPAVDAYPDDLDVAVAVDRFERATTLDVRRVSRAWAGLRTFASDGSPVVGPDPVAESFIWLAGQGGYGIKTSPALSRACAALIRREPLPDDLRRLGLTAQDLSPSRLLSGTAPLITSEVS